MTEKEIMRRLDDAFRYHIMKCFKYWEFRNFSEARRRIMICQGIAESALYCDCLFVGDLDQIRDTLKQLYCTITFEEDEEFYFFDLGERVI